MDGARVIRDCGRPPGGGEQAEAWTHFAPEAGPRAHKESKA